ncbi:MAG: hypothetical protein IAE83_08955 [Anaerolinea sp.]|nr:hypothetical protein [Anaerolinea sp.]
MISRRRLKRWAAGCFYLGCFAPFGYSFLIGWIMVDLIRRRLCRRE